MFVKVIYAISSLNVALGWRHYIQTCNISITENLLGS